MFSYVLVMVAIGSNIAVGMLGYGLDWFKWHRVSQASYEATNNLVIGGLITGLRQASYGSGAEQ